MTVTRREPFHFVMIKPSHYDDDGYPIQWLRSAIPSNTLACLFALADDARKRHILGPDVDLHLHTYDETNRRVRPARIMRTIRKQGGKALIGLVGVQSNQFPRAVDLAPARHAPAGLRQDLEAAMARLPGGARQVFVLHDVEGYRHEEIADRLGISTGTSKSQLHRARMALRGLLER